MAIPRMSKIFIIILVTIQVAMLLVAAVLYATPGSGWYAGLAFAMFCFNVLIPGLGITTLLTLGSIVWLKWRSTKENIHTAFKGLFALESVLLVATMVAFSKAMPLYFRAPAVHRVIEMPLKRRNPGVRVVVSFDTFDGSATTYRYRIENQSPFPVYCVRLGAPAAMGEGEGDRDDWGQWLMFLPEGAKTGEVLTKPIKTVEFPQGWTAQFQEHGETRKSLTFQGSSLPAEIPPGQAREGYSVSLDWQDPAYRAVFFWAYLRKNGARDPEPVLGAVEFDFTNSRNIDQPANQAATSTGSN